MLLSSIFVDMKVYALQLKHKSTTGVSNGILQNFRAASDQVFTFSRVGIGQVLKQCFLSSQIFAQRKPFSLDYVIHFHIPKKGLIVQFL